MEKGRDGWTNRAKDKVGYEQRQGWSELGREGQSEGGIEKLIDGWRKRRTKGGMDEVRNG